MEDTSTAEAAYIGLASGPLPKDVNAMDNFIGGQPITVDGFSFDEKDLTCFIDDHPLNLLAQLYAPLYPNDDEVKFRILYLFGCNSDHFKRTAKCFSYTKTLKNAPKEVEQAPEPEPEPIAPAKPAVKSFAALGALMSQAKVQTEPTPAPTPTPKAAQPEEADPESDLAEAGTAMPERRGDHPGVLLYITEQPELEDEPHVPMNGHTYKNVQVEAEEGSDDDDIEPKGKGMGKKASMKMSSMKGAKLSKEVEAIMPKDEAFTTWSLHLTNIGKGSGVAVRYARDAEPLLPTSVTLEKPAPCPHCGRCRVWEAQLLSPALHMLGSDDRTHGKGELDFLAVCVATCPEACREGLVEEEVQVVGMAQL
ncbi:Programmed cell death protein 2, C-terminal putative domain [Carpediemonas membranifera]|uniref:Programmed cell death protein 2, C-terminal putative domain n=1 Tax=Carpediemonas membranifera TaxID=201153 RepID=A0A8J6AP74_9EUKA|nr:Programmed cell death protein 2, C-terminal putative domain [Carpediemonas membranifera]|eukprot:KAG9389581.1 Programmed cell death protein 2, C-terminal putative domain [Carpediemonas membranifera]